MEKFWKSVKSNERRKETIMCKLSIIITTVLGLLLLDNSVNGVSFNRKFISFQCMIESERKGMHD